MLLTFSKQQFVDRIKSGIKIHTIREDQHNRWKPGMSIQFWFGNPRNVKSKNKPYHFANGVCIAVDNITLGYLYDEANGKFFKAFSSKVDPHIVRHFEEIYGKFWGDPVNELVGKLAINDGFDDADEMYSWFFDGGVGTFTGRLVWFKVTEIIQ